MTILICLCLFAGKPSALYEKGNPDWAPNKNLGHEKFKAPDPDRYLRKELRRKHKIDEVLQNENETEPRAVQEDAEESSDNPIGKGISHAETQTELSSAEYEALRNDNIKLREEILILKKIKNDQTFGAEQFFDSTQKVMYYTGLPNIEVLRALHEFCLKVVTRNNNSSLTTFQELVLTLCRLRLNLNVKDIAYRFGMSVPSVSKIFHKWLDTLFNQLGKVIKWPEREQLLETTPLSFQNIFGTKVVIIIDCFEVFINRPNNLKARAQTWSNYKHHNTAKFLIGICPQGCISFISKAWGGRASDKYITENCGILQNLLPGDYVLADRGFDIGDSVGFYCAEVKLPSYTKGKKQLSAKDVEQSRRIACARIHVERVIGLLRNKYTILQSTLPLDYLMKKDEECCTLDKIAVVCSALCNLCPTIISG